MTSTLTVLHRSGRPDPAVPIDPILAQQIWALLDDLPVAMVDIDLCWKCPDAVAPLTVDALITRSEGNRHDWAFLAGTATVTRRGSHVLTSALQALVTPIVTSIENLVVSAVALPKGPTAPGFKAAPDWRRCDHAPGYHSGDDIDECRCGSPSDASTWLPAAICLSSNCYNYAVKDVWCRAGGLTVGATPASVPLVLNDYAQWAVILGGDGLIPVANYTNAPPGMGGGWHVALVVSTTDFHFLRLDGSYWSHKYGPHPPQTCDASGAAIPADGIPRADLCAYKLVGYFYAPHALTIDH